MLLGAIALFALAPVDCGGRVDTRCTPDVRIELTGYHGDAARTGWNDAEACLTPERVASGLVPLFTSPALDDAVVDGTRFSPHGYASPLYLDDVAVTSPAAEPGERLPVVIAATSNGYVYAVAAADGARSAKGTILWSRSLGEPSQPARSQDGVPFGILSTPTVDLAASPPRLYVTCVDRAAGWRAFALDLGSGKVIAGWPVVLDDASLAPTNKNAPQDGSARPTMSYPANMSQRAALALSPNGGRLYVSWGSYYDAAIGWMAAIDTRTPHVDASFSGSEHDVPSDGTAEQNLASAGMWGAGGPTVDARGHVYMTTGNSPEDSGPSPGVWGNTVLAWNGSLDLAGTYSPFNYCAMDSGDSDLGGSSPVLVDLDPATTSTPRLLAFGSKQGNVYLVDRDALPGTTRARPACDPKHLASPSTDGSLLDPSLQPFYRPPDRGPLNVFGPYSDVPGDNAVNHAKMRSTPAFYRDPSGAPFLFVSGSSRRTDDLETPRAPSVARLRVVTEPGRPAYLKIDRYAPDVILQNPGAPVVTSLVGQGAVVWVLDSAAPRTAPQVPVGTKPAPRSVLYAFDAESLALLARVELDATSGKYNHPTVAHGVVYVVTDRVVAYGAP